MTDYKYVTYEELEGGEIVRIMLNRPETRNAQNRGPAGRARRRHRPGRRGRQGAGGHPRRGRPDVLLGPRHGLQGGRGRARARARPAPHDHHQRRHPQGRRGPHAPGVALLLPEHPALAEPAQDHRRPGARHGVRRRAHAHVGVRPHRGRRRRATSPTWSAPGSACAAWSTSPTRGSSGPAGPRSSC